MRNRRVMLGCAAVALVAAAAAKPPTAELRLITHDLGDPAPRRMQAAVDLGLVGVSVLYTWTVTRLAK